MKVEQVSLAEFEQLFAAGRLLDAQVIAAIYITRSFLKREVRDE